MTDRRFKTIPASRETFAHKPASWWRGTDLPAYLEAKHCRRVAKLALLVAVLAASIGLVNLFTGISVEGEDKYSALILRISQAGVFFISVGLFLLARRENTNHFLVMRLSLVYEFILCAIGSFGSQWFSAVEQNVFTAITISCVIVSVFPLIVPTPPLLTLLAALASAATGPLALVSVGWLGILAPSTEDYLAVMIFHTMCVVIAVYGSGLVYGLHREVAKALELGSYRLEKNLGKGGMGEVWTARHRLLARPAAIKMVRLDVPLDQRAESARRVMQRFEREAQVTASLTSPHTVGLFDFGLNDEGTFYYVMELLDGVDLDTLVESYGPVPAERAVHILTQACKSLSEAHDSGLIHRDIKPANIMICRYGNENDFVKVLDFGLVALGRDLEIDDKLSTDGLVAGTPGFMPPELATGSQVDGRADIYSLGCVGFWLLTGRLVFEAPNPMAMIAEHVNDAPPRPSSRSELPIPKSLDEIIISCLDKDPEKRPHSAQALSESLDSIPFESSWTPERASQWWQSHRPRTPLRALDV